MDIESDTLTKIRSFRSCLNLPDFSSLYQMCQTGKTIECDGDSKQIYKRSDFICFLCDWKIYSLIGLTQNIRKLIGIDVTVFITRTESAISMTENVGIVGERKYNKRDREIGNYTTKSKRRRKKTTIKRIAQTYQYE